MLAGARDDLDVVLRILVVNGHAFQRRLIGEMLRGLGRVDMVFAESTVRCLQVFNYFQPDLLIAEWSLKSDNGLDLVRRIRSGEAGDALRRLPIVMIGDRARPSDLARARDSGIDEFVLRPFSTAALLERIHEARYRQREFIESPSYVGPCRRRRRDESYDGPRRRLFDSTEKYDDEPDVLIRKGLARMYVQRITVLLAQADFSDRAALRELCLTCGQLGALAEDMRDSLLVSATASLFNYLKGVGAEGEMDREVVQAHLDAISQLAQLPNYRADIRQQVAYELGVMVTKKLRQAGAAA
jgi:CheY-like chemotaxis protein